MTKPNRRCGKLLAFWARGNATDPNRNARSSRTAQAIGSMAGCTVAGLSRTAIFRLPCSAGIRVTKCQPIAGLLRPPRRQASRLQRTEAALAAETAARERAERSLSETQALAHDLQTKIGHGELAKNEAFEALRRERDLVSQLRADAQAFEERLQEAVSRKHVAEQAAASYEHQLSEERHARKAAEKALKASESARETAEQLVRALSEEAPATRQMEPTRRPRAEPEVVAATISRRPRVPELPAAEPEPVKWWLNPKPVAKRRS